MQRKVIISCAVTGSADTPGRNPAVPVTPEQIARSSIDAAKAGAAIVHIHVRNPQTTKPSMDNALYREVVERIRASGTDRNLLPPDSPWFAFGISLHQFPMVAQTVLLGGHPRVGLEDNIYLEKGKMAPSNAALVEKAGKIIEVLGDHVATPNDARQILGLAPTNS